MIVVNDPASLALVPDQAIRQMIQQRMDAIASDEPYSAALHGYFLVVQVEDALESIADTIGFDPTQHPWEILEEYSECYDLLFVIDDSGFGVEIFIPKAVVTPDLIAFCKLFSVPGSC